MRLNEFCYMLTADELFEMSSDSGISDIIQRIVPNGPITQIRQIADKKVAELVPFLRRWALDHTNMINKSSDPHLQRMIEKIMNNSAGVARQIVLKYIDQCLNQQEG